MKALKTALQRFATDDRGAVLVETLVALPFLIWAYIGMFVFWDGFQTANAVQKASYLAADFVTRNATVTTSQLAGVRTTMDYMINAENAPSIRVTSVIWVAARNRLEVDWSRSIGSPRTIHTTSSIALVKDRIPEMSDLDTVIVVETWLDYEPALNMGLTDETFEQFIVTRPRFVRRVGLEVS